MSEIRKRHTGGCLCGALRYAAEGDPLFAGYRFCANCRQASGSGFIPFMGYPSSAVRFSGETRPFISKAARGGDAVGNSADRPANLRHDAKLIRSAAMSITS